MNSITFNLLIDGCHTLLLIYLAKEVSNVIIHIYSISNRITRIIFDIINKLMHLIKKIKNSKSGVLSIDKEKDIKTIKKFMYIVLEEQRNINTDFIDFVNSINKRY